MSGLPNLAGLEARLSAEPSPCGVVFVDLDDMKEVNDRHGHEVGDRVLRNAADRLTLVVPSGFAAPIGGDEFALLVPGSTTRLRSSGSSRASRRRSQSR